MRDGGRTEGGSRGVEASAERRVVEAAADDGAGTPPQVAATATARDAPRRAVVDRVVFGVDFSPASLGAARWAVRWVAGEGAPDGMRPDGMRLFAHVVPWPDGTETLDVAVDGERSVHAMRPALLGGLAGFAASLQVGRARPTVRVGRPSACLAALAAEESAQLVVLGRRRDAARQRIGEPNVVERVARRTACDVLVVPEGAREPVERVIAAVDAGPSTGGVVERALALARTHDAALTLVHVLSPAHGSYDRLVRPRERRPAALTDKTALAGSAAGAAPAETAFRDAAYAWLAWLARDAGPRVPCTLVVPTGDAGREITELAARGGPSVVVLGKRGADGAPLGSLGSVARELVGRCPSPVLLVEHEADDRGADDRGAGDRPVGRVR